MAEEGNERIFRSLRLKNQNELSYVARLLVTVDICHHVTSSAIYLLMMLGCCTMQFEL